MKTNIALAKKWISSAIADLERFLNSIEIDDFADAAFRSQFAVEKLNKSILILLGAKTQKTHEPTKILLDVLKDKEFRTFNKKTESLFNKIIDFSILFEEEGTKTRYGLYKDNDYITAEEIYESIEDINDFINNLEKVITAFITIIQEVFRIPVAELEELNKLKNIKGEILKWT